MFNKKKGYDYFDYFVNIASYACEAAEYLKDSLTNFDTSSFADRMAKMHEIENRADDEKHEMITRLTHEFLPPIDSEDIVALSHRLDDVVDSLDDVMLRFDMYCLTEVRPEAIEFADMIVACTKELKDTVTEFRNYKNSEKIRNEIIAVADIESEGDKLYSRCIKALHSDEGIDAKMLIAWTAIYDDLETCLDSCEKSTDVIEEVVMKNT